MAELLLDPTIRFWVFLPVALLTFLYGLLKHYASLLMQSEKKVDLTQIQDSQHLMRSRLLREHGSFIPVSSYYARKSYYDDQTTGYFKRVNRKPRAGNPMADPGQMQEMVKGNVLNILPYAVIGGWINYQFAGFVISKVPFPLTSRFKPMLQRGIDVKALDSSWVSSASWFFICMFGLRSIYGLVLGEDHAADQTKAMADQMSGAALSVPLDPAKAFLAEWEALQMSQYPRNSFGALEGVERFVITKKMK